MEFALPHTDIITLRAHSVLKVAVNWNGDNSFNESHDKFLFFTLCLNASSFSNAYLQPSALATRATATIHFAIAGYLFRKPQPSYASIRWQMPKSCLGTLPNVEPMTTELAVQYSAVPVSLDLSVLLVVLTSVATSSNLAGMHPFGINSILRQ